MLFSQNFKLFYFYDLLNTDSNVHTEIEIANRPKMGKYC